MDDSALSFRYRTSGLKLSLTIQLSVILIVSGLSAYPLVRRGASSEFLALMIGLGLGSVVFVVLLNLYLNRSLARICITLDASALALKTSKRDHIVTWDQIHTVSIRGEVLTINEDKRLAIRLDLLEPVPRSTLGIGESAQEHFLGCLRRHATSPAIHEQLDKHAGKEARRRPWVVLFVLVWGIVLIYGLLGVGAELYSPGIERAEALALAFGTSLGKHRHGVGKGSWSGYAFQAKVEPYTVIFYYHSRLGSRSVEIFLAGPRVEWEGDAQEAGPIDSKSLERRLVSPTRERVLQDGSKILVDERMDQYPGMETQLIQMLAWNSSVRGLIRWIEALGASLKFGPLFLRISQPFGLRSPTLLDSGNFDLALQIAKKLDQSLYGYVHSIVIPRPDSAESSTHH